MGERSGSNILSHFWLKLKPFESSFFIYQLMVRGGEREAGLRARIEALLATLEKLGRWK